MLKASDEDRKVLNPSLPAEVKAKILTDENTNNSDLDFCEYKGQVILNYAWGNQRDVCYLGEAVFRGTEAAFLKGWFPDEHPKK